MKNHIAFKFIALLLCAASLLGAVGCGLSILGLTQLDLYNKTVDQVYQERVHSAGEAMAHDKALFYAGTTLGGCPVPMMQAAHPMADGPSFNPFYYGYTLKDADGKVLESVEIPYGEQVTTYTFAVTGQYMHLVNILTPSEAEEQGPELVVEEQDYPEMLASGSVRINEIPPEGVTLSQVTVSFSGESFGSSGENIGTAFCNQEGIMVLRCPGLDLGEAGQEITAISLHDNQGNLIYEASSEHGVGLVNYAQDGSKDCIVTAYQIYRVTDAETVPAETETAPDETAVSETAEATEATGDATESTEETAADEETKAEETEAEETEEETEAETEAETESEEETAAQEDSDEENSTEETSNETASESETEAGEEDTDAASATDATEVTEETAAPTVPETTPTQTVPQETVPEITEPVLINGRPLNTYQINRIEYPDDTTGEYVTARYVYIALPEMTLELHVAPGVLTTESAYQVLRMIRSVRGYLFPAMGICLLMLAVCLVYLCCAAGRKPKAEEVRAGALNRIPLDLYGFLAAAGIGGLILAISEGGYYLMQQNTMVACAACILLGYFASLLIVGFLFACAAQIKTPGTFWWHNSLCGRFLKLCARLIRKTWQLCIRLEDWIEETGWPRLLQMIRKSLNRVKTALTSLLQLLHRGFDRFLSLLPMTWQWIFMGFVMVFILFITVAGRYEVGIILAIVFAFVLILYGANCFGKLMEATKKMNKGNLKSQVDDKMMVGSFKEFASDLNDLASVAVVAAQKQLKSERMKTELITNVTHDIKTPLTCIINYVDLLQKPHTEEESEQYLDVLDRQSQRLKKLVDDLIDMSKASTGNMAVDVTLVDAVESVNQALGEFSEKLERADLVPVFRHNEDTVAMMADGKLVWRVMNNLLSNAVKYAMPGTRLYIDLMSMDNQVLISFKNISRDELNVDAEELMERFVRGDIARNTEGSGLGLNIAKSLMELQNGQLQLLVDGDLFKVTLIFPGI